MPIASEKSNPKKNGTILVVSMPHAKTETPIDQAFLAWLQSWDLSGLRRALIFETWPTIPIEHAHGPQLVPKIANQAFDLASHLTKTRPTLLIFLSCYLWQAMNLAKDVFGTSAGVPLDPGRRITDHRLSAYLQQWSHLTVLALSMPSKNTTPAYIESLAQGVQEAFRMSGNLPKAVRDPLLDQASRELVVDSKASIERIRVRLHVDEKRAIGLFNSLQDIVYANDGETPVVLR